MLNLKLSKFSNLKHIFRTNQMGQRYEKPQLGNIMKKNSSDKFNANNMESFTSYYFSINSSSGVRSLNRIINTDTYNYTKRLIPPEPQFLIESANSQFYHIILQQRIKKFRKNLKYFIGINGPMTLDKILPAITILIFIFIFTFVFWIDLFVLLMNSTEYTKEKGHKFLHYLLNKNQKGLQIKFGSISSNKGSQQFHDVILIQNPQDFASDMDTNVSNISLNIDNLEVKFSLIWWIQGNGFLKSSIVNGVTGFIDRSQIDWSVLKPSKHVESTNDFFLESLQLFNVDISLNNGTPNRDIKILISSANFDQLREHWLLYDILSAKFVHGTFDGSLFSLTRKPNKGDFQSLKSKLKIDNLKFDLISGSASGPISWITEGNLDVEIDFDFKNQNSYSYDSELSQSQPVTFDIQLKFKNLKADVPIITNQLSLVNRALIFPIVAYINTNYTCFPLQFQTSIPMNNWDGSWSPWDAGIWDALSFNMTQEILNLLNQQKKTSNIQKYLFLTVQNLQNGINFLIEQFKNNYSLWHYNQETYFDIEI